jgi:hypothetical protein
MGNQGLGGGRFRASGRNREGGKGMRRFGQLSLCVRVPGLAGFSTAYFFGASFLTASFFSPFLDV